MIKPNIVINVKLNKWAILYFKHFSNMNQKSEEDALAVSVIWSGGKISFPELESISYTCTCNFLLCDFAALKFLLTWLYNTL